MDRNFAGQNLNGRSFRGQDLRGADFSGCQLKGCDFTDADLTGAKFCRTTMGINGKITFFKWILAFVFGVFSGFTIWILNYVVAFIIHEIHLNMIGINVFIKESVALIWISLLYAVSVGLALLVALKYRDWRIVIRYNLAIIIVAVAVAVAKISTEDVKMATTAVPAALAVAVAVVVAVTVAVAVAVVVAITAAVAVAAAGAGAGAGVFAVAVVTMTAAVTSTTTPEAIIIAAAAAAAAMMIIDLLLGWYLNHRALTSEELMLALLRRYALVWRCWGGTQFSGAKLSHTDFTEADLTAVRFANAQFQQSNFTQAKNLQLAWTYNTALELPAVRTLLTEGRIDHRDFSNLHLRGLSFKGLDLSQCNFYHADLSEADFSDCDLTEADFSEAMVYGARFSNAKMTGAIIENWGMDKHTQFDDVVCEFVFTKRNKEERNPPQGDFKPGEFSKLYQEIANTVDFIAHSPDELQALLRAIDHIKQEGGDIVIQSLERKNESVVVRTQSQDGIDKATIYAEVKEQMEKEMNLLQQEKQLLLQKVDLQAQHIDTFTQILSKAVEGPKIMNDHSRHYGNISAHNSAVNLGDASTVSNHIEQVADAELKAALQTLQQLLADSHLSVIDKQEAHKAVDDLAIISQKPEAERKSLARRSLAFLKDLQQDLSSVAELGEQYGKLLVKVMAWF